MLCIRNLPKLFTRDDPWVLHKTLGFACLGHFVLRLTQAPDLGFRRDAETIFWILMHAALSWSSLIFKIPTKRIAGKPMIYPEFRLHSIAFATRSLASMLLVYLDLTQYNIVLVLATMAAADTITAAYHDPTNGNTMRDMPTTWNRDFFQAFYAMSQVLATMEILVARSFDKVFLLLIPIQLAAFTMTLVRKSILTTEGWHIIYSLSLGICYVYGFTNGAGTDRLTYWITALGVYAGRVHFRWNKYNLWVCAWLATSTVYMRPPT